MYLTTQLGAYSKLASIELEADETCDVCKQTRAVLAIDTSNQEYATLLICQECTGKFFTGHLA